MATVLDRPAATEARAAYVTNAALNAFLAELSELSRRHGIGLTDGATLYLMEPEDFTRSYTASDESELSFS